VTAAELERRVRLLLGDQAEPPPSAAAQLDVAQEP
jgi:hypothetical protein